MIGIIAEIIIVWWIFTGIFGYVIGWFGDILFYRKIPISPVWVLIGPFLFFISMKSFIHGIYYAIKKKKHLRKCR
jgi:hypothetical protein